MKKRSTLLHVVPLLLVLTVLILALTACDPLGGNTTTEAPATTTTGSSGTPTSPTLPAIWNTATYRENTTLGTGATAVTVKVTADGSTVTITLLTDEATLADALLAEGLCAGENSQYGLYLSHVNGIRADYTLDNGYWWNLIVNGEASMVGVSGVTITVGDVYELVRTK